MYGQSNGAASDRARPLRLAGSLFDSRHSSSLCGMWHMVCLSAQASSAYHVYHANVTVMRQRQRQSQGPSLPFRGSYYPSARSTVIGVELHTPSRSEEWPVRTEAAHQGGANEERRASQGRAGAAQQQTAGTATLRDWLLLTRRRSDSSRMPTWRRGDSALLISMPDRTALAARRLPWRTLVCLGRLRGRYWPC